LACALIIDATGGVHELLRSSVERMAGVADTEQKYAAGGTVLIHVAAGATEFPIPDI